MDTAMESVKVTFADLLALTFFSHVLYLGVLIVFAYFSWYFAYSVWNSYKHNLKKDIKGVIRESAKEVLDEISKQRRE